MVVAMSETTVTTPIGLTAIDRFLQCVERGTGFEAGVFAPEAVVDATVPNWRFRKEGAEAVRAELGSWFAAPAVFEELRRVPLPGGELIEFALSWEEEGVPFACHQVHLVDVDPQSGAIRADRVWCGGRWDAALLAEMEAAAHAG